VRPYGMASLMRMFFQPIRTEKMVYFEIKIREISQFITQDVTR